MISISSSIFQENIYKIIAKKKITISDLSKKSHISRVTISNYLNKKQDIRLSTAVKISKGIEANFIQLNELNLAQSNGRDLINKSFDSSISTNDYLHIIRQNIKRYCAKNSQKSLSSFPGVSEAEISNLINGKTRDPYMRSLEYIASLMNDTKSLADLLIRR